MTIIKAIKYIATHAAWGAVIGLINAVWLEFLWWESARGPDDDHSYDYIAAIIWIVGALIGALAGGWMAYAILRNWDKLPK